MNRRQTHSKIVHSAALRSLDFDLTLKGGVATAIIFFESEQY
jgi:hypothetical protein